MSQAKQQIESEIKSEVIQSLQQQLANAFLLYANYKKYHWQSYGPLFRDLHLLFDEHAAAVLGTIDELGERVRILGGSPVADPRQFIERGTVKVAAVNRDMRGMIEEAMRNHNYVIQETRQAIYRAERADDPGTTDLFTRLLSLHEKQHWFLKEILEHDDGLVGAASAAEQ
jgi:starvation-inducible DNA-binding protein